MLLRQRSRHNLRWNAKSQPRRTEENDSTRRARRKSKRAWRLSRRLGNCDKLWRLVKPRERSCWPSWQKRAVPDLRRLADAQPDEPRAQPHALEPLEPRVRRDAGADVGRADAFDRAREVY